MAFGFSGAHRTGKTTLAKKVAEDLGYFFHDASVSKIVKELGMNAVGDLPMEQRIEAQEFLLKRYRQDLANAPRPLVTDRTPLDMIGYMLGEVTMHNTSAAVGERIQAYVDDCISATITHFDTVLIVGPLTAYAVEDGKPPLNRAYQSLVQCLIEGSARQVSRLVNLYRIEASDFEQRRLIAIETLRERMEELAGDAKAVKRH